MLTENIPYLDSKFTSLSQEEIETIIVLPKSSLDKAFVHTNDSSVFHKLIKTDTFSLVDKKYSTDGLLVETTFSTGKKNVSFRTTNVKRELTDEQRQVLVERMKNLSREKKKS